jgi:SAM-dependent methyltransferase
MREPLGNDSDNDGRDRELNGINFSMTIQDKSNFDNQLIPFYGGEHPHLFEIERRCMDRDGKVIRYLDQILPLGLVLDIGAGNGFTATRLITPERLVIPLEPDPRMIDTSQPLVWAKGVAQAIPFHDRTFDAAYATWAFFFDGVADILQGLNDAQRVVKPNGLLVIVDNAGEDEFCALAPRNIASNRAWWKEQGFQETILHTSYRFDSLEEANTLLSFYFGEEVGKQNQKTEIEYNVVVYTIRVKEISGPEV